jgi:hypothetical protein
MGLRYLFFLPSVIYLISLIYIIISYLIRVKWVPVTTAWRVLRLRMEERPPVMQGSCEYIE